MIQIMETWIGIGEETPRADFKAEVEKQLTLGYNQLIVEHATLVPTWPIILQKPKRFKVILRLELSELDQEWVKRDTKTFWEAKGNQMCHQAHKTLMALYDKEFKK